MEFLGLWGVLCLFSKGERNPWCVLRFSLVFSKDQGKASISIAFVYFPWWDFRHPPHKECLAPLPFPANTLRAPPRLPSSETPPPPLSISIHKKHSPLFASDCSSPYRRTKKLFETPAKFRSRSLSDPTEIPPPHRGTGVAIPLSHGVSCGIADYRCYTPTSFQKNGLSQSKDRPNKGGNRRKSLPLKPIAL